MSRHMGAITAAKLAEWFDAHAAALVLYARQWLGPAPAEDVQVTAERRRAARALLRTPLLHADGAGEEEVVGAGLDDVSALLRWTA